MAQYFQETVEQIRKCVQFDSSPSAYTSATPFGKGAADCLNYFLDLAKSLGFETNNYDNYIGEVIFGKGTEEFAILCHLDVVPAGKGWTKEPFGGEISDGKIWGRGTTDDKGPAVCTLYALKALKDDGFAPSKKIKLIVGCNEESGWHCIEHYKECAMMPETGFSPDADFPVIYAEKGILQVRLHFPLAHAPFLYLSGGEQGNMVCDLCDATPRSLSIQRARLLNLQIRHKKIISHGKSAHASTPELGENAILPILRFFEGKSSVIKHIIECVFDDVYGLGKLEDETGKLTMSPNVIRYRKGQISLLVDIRYPATVPPATVLSLIDKFGVKYETVHSQAPLYHEKDSDLVKALSEVYEECTGEKTEPIAIGGGTYARALENGVGFGPEMPGEDCHIHQADEFISLDRVKLLLNVYKKAIERLTK